MIFMLRNRRNYFHALALLLPVKSFLKYLSGKALLHGEWRGIHKPNTVIPDERAQSALMIRNLGLQLFFKLIKSSPTGSPIRRSKRRFSLVEDDILRRHKELQIVIPILHATRPRGNDKVGIFRAALQNVCRFLILVNVCSILQSCSSGETPPGVTLQTVSFSATPDANFNTATSVDLVMVYEKNLFGTLKKMTAEQYFSSIDQLRQDNPEFLYIWRWELVPGQVGDFRLEPIKDQAWGMLLFADYSTPGEHRASVGPFSAISIFLEDKDFRLKKEQGPLSNTIVVVAPVTESTVLNTRVPAAPEKTNDDDSSSEKSPAGDPK